MPVLLSASSCSSTKVHLELFLSTQSTLNSYDLSINIVTVLSSLLGSVKEIVNSLYLSTGP